ncbi:hypothetical protein V8E36_009834, partial [Tilletia maclaganii]
MPLLVAALDTAPSPSQAEWDRPPPFIKCNCVVLPEPTHLKVFDLCRQFSILLSTCRQHMPATLFRHHMFPATPKQPRAAFSLPLLLWYTSLRKHTSVTAFSIAKTLDDIFRQKDPDHYHSDHLRKQIMGSSTWYQATQQYISRDALHNTQPWLQARPALPVDDLLLTKQDLADSCPACFQQFFLPKAERIPPKTPQVVVSIDGNFSLKRKDRDNIDTRQALPPRRFLSKAQVDRAEVQLKAARLSARTGTDHHQCYAIVKAADPDAAKGALGPHDITGVMGLCCRHDVPLIFCDVDSPGERHHYAVALLMRLLAALDGEVEHIGAMYDIGCRFADNTAVQQALDTNVRITWTIPLFHVYGHTYSCHIRYSPRNVEGMGWIDGEGMERVWSSVSELVASTRSMAQTARRFHLEERFQSVAEQRRRRLARWIHEKLKVAQETEKKSRQAFKATKGTYSFLKKRVAPKKKILTSQVPENFPAVNQKLFNLLSYMSQERRRLALEPNSPAAS